MILSPNKLSDIATIEMDGNSEYYVRKDAFLARSPRVSINIGHIRGMVSGKRFFRILFS